MDKKIKSSNNQQFDFIDMIKLIADQKVIVIFCVLSFVAFSSITSYMKNPLYLSNVRLITAQYDNNLVQPYSELSSKVKFFFKGINITDLNNGFLNLSITSESVDDNELRLNEAVEFIIDDSKQKLDVHKNNLLNDIFIVRSRISIIETELSNVKNVNSDAASQLYMSNLRIKLNDYLLEERSLEEKLLSPNLFLIAREHGNIENLIISTNYYRKIISFAILGFILSLIVIFTKKALFEIRN